MQCYFEHVGLFRRRLFRNLLDRTLEITGNKTEDVSVGIRFVSADEIQSLNREKRQIDRVTDVLSFPMLDIVEGQSLQEFDAERLPTGELFIGDIVVCVSKAKQQAKAFRHSLKRELCFLIVHGYLHLLGFDHMDPVSEKRMMNLTENILLNFSLERKDHV